MTLFSKKMAVGTLTIAMSAAVLTGCGSNSNTTNKTETNTNTQSGNATAGTGSGLTGDFEIQYFVGGYGDKWWKKVIADFQAANPDLNIIQDAGPQINDQNKPKWIAGTPPDFVYIDGAGINDRQMVEDGQLEDLTDWFKTATNVDGVKISDLLAQQPQEYDGKVYNIPLVMSSWGIYYNKALFKQKGWAEPTDWDTFLSDAATIKADGQMSPFIHTGKYPYYINNSFLYPAIVSANGDDPSILQKMAANDVTAFQSQAVLDGLNKIVELRDKGYIDSASTTINHTDSQMLFLQNKDAFIPNGLWLPNEMAGNVPSDFEFGFIPSVTQAKSGKTVAITSTSTVGIAEQAKNKDAAKAFMQFIFAQSQASEFAELSGAPSNIKGDISASNAPEFVKQAASYLTSDSTVVVPTITFNADVDQAMMDATVALSIGKIDPKGWVDRVVAVAKKAS